MPEKEKVNFVYMATRTNKNGFTFIESLLTISILLMTLPFIGYLVKGTDFTSNYDQLAGQQFFYFLRDEVIRSTEVTIEPSTLALLQQDGTTASIKRNGNRIIRNVDGKGFEVYLQHVRDVRFTSVPHGVHVSITMTDGEQYETDISIYQ
ncbi:competence type IV pilus minor pilin ComGF [Lentibacillus juripiscarius]|uniref:Competence type IV pilus minor pilin ComGF n=2 Tax=Lentibacillus juripiscarius TaxID=257446 RepID=A0ABW5V471_9BACI